MLLVVGCFNLIHGIAAIANSHVFTASAHHVFGSPRTWGWITLIIGVLQLLAAAGVSAAAWCNEPRRSGLAWQLRRPVSGACDDDG